MAGKAKKRVQDDFGHFILHTSNIHRTMETRNHHTTQIAHSLCTVWGSVALSLSLILLLTPCLLWRCTHCVFCKYYLLTLSLLLSLQWNLLPSQLNQEQSHSAINCCCPFCRCPASLSASSIERTGQRKMPNKGLSSLSFSLSFSLLVS